MLKLNFLGTSAGMPTKQRNVTALAVSLVCAEQTPKKTPWLLVDCGEGTQHQLLKTPLSMMQLEVIAITHLHGDHCYGLFGLLASMAMNGRKTPLTLIAPQALAPMLEMVMATTQLNVNFAIHFVSTQSLLEGKPHHHYMLAISPSHHVTIEVIALSHRMPSHAFKITQAIDYTHLDSEKLLAKGVKPSHIWGKLQHGYDVTLGNSEILKAAEFCESRQQKTAIIVAGDNDTPACLSDAMAGVGLLVHEATYTQAVADKIRQTKPNFDPMHTSAKQIAQFAQSAALPNLILTHFSGRFQPFNNPSSATANMGHIDQEVRQYYQNRYWLARDFDAFEVTGDSVEALATSADGDC